MPAVLWPTLRKNRRLLNDLPAPGTAVTDQWSKDTYGARLMIMVVPHTFGWHLNFNPHLHVLVSAGGLRTSDGVWIQRCHLDKTALMKRWRYALIAYLREAFKRGLLLSAASAQETRRLLTTQYESWWNVDVQPRMTKEHFLQYAGSYARRPPLAQYRIPEHTDEQISFRTKDHKLKREVVTRYTPDEFIGLLADHVPDHYQHAIRHFGILAPRLKSHTFGALFCPIGTKAPTEAAAPQLGSFNSEDVRTGSTVGYKRRMNALDGTPPTSPSEAVDHCDCRLTKRRRRCGIRPTSINSARSATSALILLKLNRRRLVRSAIRSGATV